MAILKSLKDVIFLNWLGASSWSAILTEQPGASVGRLISRANAMKKIRVIKWRDKGTSHCGAPVKLGPSALSCKQVLLSFSKKVSSRSVLTDNYVQVLNSVQSNLQLLHVYTIVLCCCCRSRHPCCLSPYYCVKTASHTSYNQLGSMSSKTVGLTMWQQNKTNSIFKINKIILCVTK